MDNNQISKLLTRRNIFIALGAVIIAEVIWAGWALYKPPLTQVSIPKKVVQSVPNTISLQASKNTLKVGEQVTVSINLSSDKTTDGTDLIIIYDPKVLSVEARADKAPIVPGILYSEYPVNKVDATLGKITVSGISNKSGGIKANGLFGSIVFTAKAAGQTQVSLDFTPGKTTDSNMIQTGTGKDVLEKVNNLELTVTP